MSSTTKDNIHTALVLIAVLVGWIVPDPAKIAVGINIWYIRFIAAVVCGGGVAILCMASDFSDLIHDTVLKRRD